MWVSHASQILGWCPYGVGFSGLPRSSSRADADPDSDSEPDSDPELGPGLVSGADEQMEETTS